MEEFVKRLHYLDDQPCIMLDNKLYALIDTGAKIPVWTKSESALLTYYPDAKKALVCFFAAFIFILVCK